MAIFTVGHSTRSLDELVDVLQEREIEVLADVRTAPGSRRLPHFSQAALSEQLPARGIRYLHLPELGGFRRPLPDSPNAGWRKDSFRGYADYMATTEWRQGLQRLIDLGSDANTAAMCAEALPWRCHRSLIADGLVASGVPVVHLLGRGKSQSHALTPFAVVKGGRITYPPPDRLPVDG